MAQLLEHIFCEFGVMPDEVMNKTDGTRAFMFACAIRDIGGETFHAKKQQRQVYCPLLQQS
jgi:hypothetical protein|nr:MAG TPA: hypothetical protein [Caudoviricetes sp.]